jgi:hypothetical protein
LQQIGWRADRMFFHISGRGQYDQRVIFNGHHTVCIPVRYAVADININIVSGELQVFIGAGEIDGDIGIFVAELAQTAQQP